MNKKVWIILVAFALPFGTQAQLTKLMSKYHEKNCVTVTQLNKNLYGLYKKQHLPPEAEEALQNLDAVNILNLDLTAAGKAQIADALHLVADAHTVAAEDALVEIHRNGGTGEVHLDEIGRAHV